MPDDCAFYIAEHDYQPGDADKQLVTLTEGTLGLLCMIYFVIFIPLKWFVAFNSLPATERSRVTGKLLLNESIILAEDRICVDWENLPDDFTQKLNIWLDGKNLRTGKHGKIPGNFISFNSG